jgi:hypothetical protein
MSGRTQFWLGALMLALAIGILVGGLVSPRVVYSQDAGEGRSGNYAIVASNLPGSRPKSQLIYVMDDRNEAMYVIEAVSSKSSRAEMRDFIDLRELGTGLQKKRAEREAREERRRGVR